MFDLTQEARRTDFTQLFSSFATNWQTCGLHRKHLTAKILILTFGANLLTFHWLETNLSRNLTMILGAYGYV